MLREKKLDSPLNFDLHIKEYISPVMKELGFRKKNLVYTRLKGRYEETVVLQKSAANSSSMEKTVFVNYYINLPEDKNSCAAFSRLNNKMKNQFHDFWSFFDEGDLVKMLDFLGTLLKDYTDTFFTEMEKYLDQFETLNSETCMADKTVINCKKIFDEVQKTIPEKEILSFNAEREKTLPPALKMLSYKDTLYEGYNLTKFDAEILNLGKSLKGLKVIITGSAIDGGSIDIKKICCYSHDRELLFEEDGFTVNEFEKGKYLAFDFPELEMKPCFDGKKIEELSLTDRFASQRAEKYSKLDSVRFEIYYDIKKAEGDFMVYFCPAENFEKGQAGFTVKVLKNETE